MDFKKRQVTSLELLQVDRPLEMLPVFLRCLPSLSLVSPPVQSRIEVARIFLSPLSFRNHGNVCSETTLPVLIAL